MTKIEQLTTAASALSSEQLDGLLEYTRYLAAEPFYRRAPADALASIDRGLADLAAGRVQNAADVFSDLRLKIDASQS